MSVIKGLTAGPIFGVADTDYAAGMSLEKEDTGEKTELKNGDSQIIAVAYHSDKKPMTYTGKIKGALPSWKRGDAITVDGVTAYLDNVSETKREGDFAEIKIELTDYPDFA
jgi:hypothetical protein